MTQLKPVHFRFWEPIDHEELAQAGTSLIKSREIALRVMGRMPPGLHMVSGPMTTGGLGTIRENLELVALTIEHLAAEGYNVWSQMPFEANMIAFHKEWEVTCQPGEYCWPILHDFYEYLFQSGKIERLHFIHGYRHSRGAKWEHEQCSVYNMGKTYLSKKLARDLFALIKRRQTATV